ncbi:MAG: ABC transporter ATP-binding protein [Desulfobacterales bacterium]
MAKTRPERPLVVRQLRKTYPGDTAPALRDVDLHVDAGEALGLLGPNGAGKTTAISIMSTLMRPDSGEVAICGIDIFTQTRRAKRHFGLVPQEIALYPSLTCRENLHFFGRLAGLTGRRLKDRTAECLDLVGLTASAAKRVATFSGGMKRRANIAAGILHNPELLFLDEPTVGIDAQSRHMILEMLAGLARRGTGMIYTTHYMEEAQWLCSRVAIIDQGEIVGQGPPSELIAREPGCSDLGGLFLRLTGKQLRD